ncbi:MAG: hypothetical protein ABSH20_02735 [Tepidisphaeraceae bacterium]|jgi:hypothetical protein
MPLLEIELHPEKGQLRIFGLALAAILAVLAWRVHWAIGIAAALAATLAVVFPTGLRWVYVAMMVVPYPVGIAMSWAVLAVIYYGVVTPVGWLARVCGRDELNLGPRPHTETYWVKRKAPPTNESYFHQW